MKARTALESMIGTSAAMARLRRTIDKVAARVHPVLIQGESGTGKELVARSIHAQSDRRERPFVVVDCGALPPTLAESELFGYVAGAFTGASRAKEGLIAAADGGILFLDEIGELPIELQPKLLRVLQEGEVRALGATQPSTVEVRVIAATHRDLKARVKEGTFREDLYFRLAVVTLKVPAVRDRREDIPLLARHFAALSAGPKFDTTILPDAMDILLQYDWPGNVRELANAIERAVALNTNGPIRREDLPTVVQASTHPSTASGNGSLSIAEAERHAIEHALKRANNNKIEAARLLGIGKTTLYRKLKEYGK
jgi:transcriptional regulator with PAS, ATPase and Fis domain